VEAAVSLSSFSFVQKAGFEFAAGQALPGTAITGDPTAAVNSTRETQVALAAGTGSGLATKLVRVVRQLAGGASETLDLAAGTWSGGGNLLDVFGAQAAFTTVRAIQVEKVPNPSGANSTGMTVGAAASNPWVGWFGNGTAAAPLAAGGLPYAAGDAAGKTVTASSADKLKFVNSDPTNTLTYLLLLAGN
jgi:hypothetical protein